MTIGVMEKERNSRRLTLILVNLAAVLERADEALLPAVYDQVLRSSSLPFQTASLRICKCRPVLRLCDEFGILVFAIELLIAQPCGSNVISELWLIRFAVRH